MMRRRISDALQLGHRDSLRHYQAATQDQPLWPIDWRYFWFVVRHIFWYSDSLQTRAVMGTCSIGWSVSLIVETSPMTAPAYSLMRILPPWVWSILFGVHGVLAWWRILEKRERKEAAFWTNLTGVIVWLGYVLAVDIAVGHLAPTTILEACMILLLTCATINTGRNESRGTE